MLNFISKSKAGSFEYTTTHLPGSIDIWHDSSRYVYKQNRRNLKKFKDSICTAFSNNGSSSVKISGNYPSYEIESIN